MIDSRVKHVVLNGPVLFPLYIKRFYEVYGYDFRVVGGKRHESDRMMKVILKKIKQGLSDETTESAILMYSEVDKRWMDISCMLEEQGFSIPDSYYIKNETMFLLDPTAYDGLDDFVSFICSISSCSIFPIKQKRAHEMQDVLLNRLDF